MADNNNKEFITREELNQEIDRILKQSGQGSGSSGERLYVTTKDELDREVDQILEYKKQEKSDRTWIFIIIAIIAFIAGLLSGYIVHSFVNADGCGKLPAGDFDVFHAYPNNNFDVQLKKPVVYAYGYDDFSLTLDMPEDVHMTCSYPLYQDGWDFKMIDDKFMSDGHTYDYLYYEAETENKFKINQGFCVQRDDTVEFLEEYLKFFGLNDRETEDFITYWLPDLMKNEYNLISFQNKEYSDMIGMTFNEEPDTLIRVYMVWQGLDKPVNIAPQMFKTPAEREGKTVVEWGGTELAHF